VSGVTCFYFGDFSAAHDHSQKTIELYDQARATPISSTGSARICVAAEIFDAVTLWVLGQIDEALPLADRALTDAIKCVQRAKFPIVG
jgi:hypothetical protein